MLFLLEKELVGANGFVESSSRNLSRGTVLENALFDRSSSAGPGRKVTHWAVEAREGADEEGDSR